MPSWWTARLPVAGPHPQSREALLRHAEESFHWVRAIGYSRTPNVHTVGPAPHDDELRSRGVGCGQTRSGAGNVATGRVGTVRRRDTRPHVLCNSRDLSICMDAAL